MQFDERWPRYMMANEYTHKLFKNEMKSCNEYDLCVVDRIEGDNYIGRWVFGLAIHGIKFPIRSTRELNEDDIKQYHNARVSDVGIHKTLDVITPLCYIEFEGDATYNAYIEAGAMQNSVWHRRYLWRAKAEGAEVDIKQSVVG